MSQIVEIPGQGEVEFPDSMKDEEIVAAIKKIKTQQNPSFLDRAKSLGKEGAHFLGKAAPVVGGIVGGAAGAGLGTVAGVPSGPGAILTGIGGAALGAGLLSAAGKSVQHSIDTAIGYEENPGIPAVTKDAIKTGAQDAAFTAAGGMAIPLAMRAAGAAAPAIDALGNRLGRRVLNGGATPLTVKKPISPAALDAAQEAGAFRPWGTTRSAATKIDAARDATGADYARIVKELEAAGVKGPDIPQLAQEFLQRGSTARANTLNPAVPHVFDSAAEQVGQQASVPYAPGQGALKLSQAENMKRSLQGMAKSSYQQLDPVELGEAKQEAASLLRGAIEKAVEQQSGFAPKAAAEFVPVKQRLGPLIEAGNAAERGAAMADRRQAFSLTDLLAAGAGGHGDPVRSAGSALASKALRTYGPSAGTWALKGGSDVLEGLASLSAPGAVRAGAAVGAAADAHDEGLSLQAILDSLRRHKAGAMSLATQ